MTAFGTACARLSCALLVFAVYEADAQDVRMWLDRMNRAVEELNYEGTFVHVLDGNAETLHVVHRNHHGKISERIMSLDGVGREIIREGDTVRVILPDRELVLLEEARRSEQSPLTSSLPSYSEGLEPHYEFEMYRSARVAKRPVQVIGIKPKDEYRYGYMLWLDRETAMPLKSQIRDENDDIVEQILFTQIQISDFIPASALHPAIDTEGFTFLRTPPPQPDAHAGDGEKQVLWRASILPGGFRLSAAMQRVIAGSDYPVEHLVYSDGLATVSVFIEDPKNDADVLEGFSSVGSTNAFSLTLDGRKVTAIGEVPKQTVRTIATSLSAE
ncbi:MAG: MucB/RseB C-terminal domain-containing protein [Gammaproteobacteria bacterium]|nr:MucB/RseB C-terminal domain-containing protein [Gammaproteobacteria bacterium]